MGGLSFFLDDEKKNFLKKILGKKKSNLYKRMVVGLVGE